MAMTLRLSDKELQTLRRQADREGVSMQELIKRSIQDRADRWEHSARVTSSSHRMTKRWADVLDDLSKS